MMITLTTKKIEKPFFHWANALNTMTIMRSDNVIAIIVLNLTIKMMVVFVLTILLLKR